MLHVTALAVAPILGTLRPGTFKNPVPLLCGFIDMCRAIDAELVHKTRLLVRRPRAVGES
jgi:hypothetical protein